MVDRVTYTIYSALSHRNVTILTFQPNAFFRSSYLNRFRPMACRQLLCAAPPPHASAKRFYLFFFFFLIFLLKRLGRFSPGPKYKFVCFVEEQQKKNHNGGDPLEGSARVCPHARWDPWRLHNGIPTQTNNIPFVLLHSIYTCSYIGRPNLDVESLHTRMRDPFFFRGLLYFFSHPPCVPSPGDKWWT